MDKKRKAMLDALESMSGGYEDEYDDLDEMDMENDPLLEDEELGEEKEEKYPSGPGITIILGMEDKKKKRGY